MYLLGTQTHTHFASGIASYIILDYMYYADIVTSLKLNACLFRIV